MMPMFRCAFCQHANPAGSTFCNECGSALRLKPCERCDAINDHDATNCHQCGAGFDDGLALDSTVSPARPSPAEEPSPSVVRPFEAAPADQARLRNAVAVATTTQTSPIVMTSRNEPSPPSKRFRKTLAAALLIAAGGAAYSVYRESPRSLAPIDRASTGSAMMASGRSSTAAPTEAATSRPIRDGGSASSQRADLAESGGATAEGMSGSATSRDPRTPVHEDANPKGPETAKPGVTPAAPVVTSPAAGEITTKPAAGGRAGRTRTYAQVERPPRASAQKRPSSSSIVAQPDPVPAGNCTASVAALGLCVMTDVSARN